MKWYGQIAYSNQIETEPGIFEDVPEVRNYYGDVLKVYKRDETGSQINPDISVSNQLSVVADPFLMNSFHKILYVTFGGAKWKVSSVEVQYPRLLIQFGGLYSEEGEQ